MSLADSIFQTASIAPCTSVVVTATITTFFALAAQHGRFQNRCTLCGSGVEQADSTCVLGRIRLQPFRYKPVLQIFLQAKARPYHVWPQARMACSTLFWDTPTLEQL